jgi:predicted glycosyl hydrolase (DUF1957 family)
MWWINFLHLYQPANLEPELIKEAVAKSYRRLIQLLEKKTNLKMTMNISACLIERLEEEGYTDLINRLKSLVAGHRLELVGSAAFHGFLPNLPAEEVIWQIEYQEKVLKKYFNLKNIKGFFIPEMAYHPQVAKIIAQKNYQWLILDEIASTKDIDFNYIYKDKDSGLKVVFRQREYSNAYPPDKINILRRQKETPKAIVTAVDGELYGLRHLDPQAQLERIVFWSSLKTATVSEYINSNQEEIKEIQLRKSSWESTEKELKANNPYILWNDPKNDIQQALWQLANLALSMKTKYPLDKNLSWYRWHLNRGLASCWFWWASAYDFTHNYGPLAWSPDQIEKGINDLLRAIRSFENQDSKEEKIRAEKLVAKLRQDIWLKHWQKFV